MKPMTHVVIAMILVLVSLSRESFGKEPANKLSSKRKSHCELVQGAHVAFYDVNGKEIKRIVHVNYESAPGRNGITQFHSVNFSGCYAGEFVAVIDRRGSTDDEASFIKSTDTVSFYSSEGRRLWKKKLLPLGFGNAISVSANDRRLWYVSEETKSVVALDANGNERVFEIPDAKTIILQSLSPNGRCSGVTVYSSDASGKPSLDGERSEFFDFDSGDKHVYLGRGQLRCSKDGLAEVLEENQTGWAQPEKIIHAFQFK